MKKYKTTIIITTLITLLPIVIGLFLWNKLPDTLATHWGSDGTANGWSSKTFSVFGMPLILTAIHVLCLFVTLNDPKKKNIHKKPMALIFWLVPVISLLANCSTYLIALGVDFSIEIFISALIGVFFIVLGNYMPKLQQNYTIGIKLPWTLNSEENWNRTHSARRQTLYCYGNCHDFNVVYRQLTRKRSRRMDHPVRDHYRRYNSCRLFFLFV